LRTIRGSFIVGWTAVFFALAIPSLIRAAEGPAHDPTLEPAQESSEAARIDQLERELTAIRAEIARMKAADAEESAPPAASAPEGEDDRFAEIMRRIDILAQEIEREKVGESLFLPAEKSEHGLGVAASKVYQVEQGISLGGYGEALYQSFDSARDDGTASDATDQLDLERGVFYFGYKWNDHWLFNSEIEFEHAGASDDNGEISLEFAYVDYLWRPRLNVRAGLVLVPMGFINELHEPPLFLGARRPDVERRIIPATWRENGVGIFGDIGPFRYRTYLLNGLDARGFSSHGIRGGRQNGSKADAEDLAWTGRIDYTGQLGLLAGVSFYVGDSGQGLRDAEGRTIGARTTLYDAHIEWKHRGLELRVLGARGEIDDTARLNAALGLRGSASIAETFEGYYLQVGYDLLARRGRSQRSLTPFVRVEGFDTQHEVPTGFSRNPARNIDILTFGIAFKPFDQMVIKGDYQNFDNDAGTGVDQFNLALGYLF